MSKEDRIESQPFYELYKQLLKLKEYRANPEAAYATADFVWQSNYRLIPVLKLLTDEEIEEYAKEEGARGYPIKSAWLTDEIMVHVKDIAQAQRDVIKRQLDA